MQQKIKQYLTTMRFHERIVWGLIVVLCALLTSRSAMADECGYCAALLREGVFNTTVISANSSTAESFRQWQCASTFSTHNEAIRAGARVTFPLYGIPVTPGLDFDQSKVSAWKSANCSETERSASASTKLLSLVRVVDATLANQYVECIRVCQTSQQTGLSCRLERSGTKAKFSARYVPQPGVESTTVAIEDWSSTSTLVDPNKPGVLASGRRVGSGRRWALLNANPGTKLTVLIHTKHEDCVAELTIPPPPPPPTTPPTPPQQPANTRWLDGASDGRSTGLVNGTSHGTLWKIGSVREAA